MLVKCDQMSHDKLVGLSVVKRVMTKAHVIFLLGFEVEGSKPLSIEMGVGNNMFC